MLHDLLRVSQSLKIPRLQLLCEKYFLSYSYTRIERNGSKFDDENSLFDGSEKYSYMNKKYSDTNNDNENIIPATLARYVCDSNHSFISSFIYYRSRIKWFLFSMGPRTQQEPFYSFPGRVIYLFVH